MGPPRDSAGAGGPRNRPTTGECRGLPFVADPVKRVGSQRRNAHQWCSTRYLCARDISCCTCLVPTVLRGVETAGTGYLSASRVDAQADPALPTASTEIGGILSAVSQSAISDCGEQNATRRAYPMWSLAGNTRHSAESAREKRGGDVAGVGPPLVGRIVPGSFASFVGTLDHWFDNFFGETRSLLQTCPASLNGSNNALSVV